VERSANWAAANVEAGAEGFVLRVPIEGDPNPDWDDAFRTAVEARRHEMWGRARAVRSTAVLVELARRLPEIKRI
jgi:hypothetical protein